jgi:phosphoribosyl-AMP cyclohydrolase
MDADVLLAQIRWNADGLVPAIAQDADSGTVLMLAWMNADALRATLQENFAVYWSRSRGKLWRKGETSGNVQHLVNIALDCDGDTLLLKVRQKGAACHTGRRHCFFHEATPAGWRISDPVLQDPATLYGSKA